MENRLKVVFMGTPDFSVPALKKINENFDILAVYSQPDRPVGRGLEMKQTPVKQEALKLGIPVFQPDKLSQPGEFERLQSLNPDVIVVVAFGQILRKNVLTLPRLGCVNIHSSILPRWRGAAPIHHALLSGDSETGVTTMKMAEGLDTGDIYLIEKTPIHPREMVNVLHDRLAEIGGELIVKTLIGLNAGAITGIPQDESKVTFATKLTKEMESLSSHYTAREADLRVRALNPWPGVSVNLKILDGKMERLKIRQAEPHSELSAPLGKLSESAGMLLLGLKEGSLELRSVQPEGKKEMTASAFLNGLKGRGISLPIEILEG
jgi:methionyl-tRNA formyltransferase